MEKKTIKQLKAKLDKLFSLWIRQKDAIGGYTKCITCSKIQRWQDQDCGHFQSRRYLATRWEEMNCAPQCKDCNLFNQGKQDEFGRKIAEKYGQSMLEILRIKKNNTMKLGTFEYEILIEMYEQKLKELK